MDDDLQPLYWEASFEIVLTLKEKYPEANLNTLGLDQLYDWIIALPHFADDPLFANEDILNEILREWYEETLFE